MSIVVTGIGAASRLGLRLGDHLAGLGGTGEIADLPSGDEILSVEALAGTRNVQFMDRTTALSVYAAGQALNEAGFGEAASETTGLVLGSANGSLKSIAAMTEDTFTRHPPYHVSAMEFPNTVMNAAAGNCAIRLGLRGLNATVSAGTLSGIAALQYAINKLKLGYATSLLVGAAEEQSAFTRQMQAQGRGLLGAPPLEAGEGAVFLHLEMGEFEPEQPGRGHFEVLFCRMIFDPQPDAGHRAGALERLVRDALAETGLAPASIGVVALGNTGIAQADAVEAAMLSAIFGNDRPVVVGLSSALGDTASAQNLFQLLHGLAAPSRGQESAPRLVVASDFCGRIGVLLIRGRTRTQRLAS